MGYLKSWVVSKNVWKPKLWCDLCLNDLDLCINGDSVNKEAEVPKASVLKISHTLLIDPQVVGPQPHDPQPEYTIGVDEASPSSFTD